jgi:hypothetical protein
LSDVAQQLYDAGEIICMAGTKVRHAMSDLLYLLDFRFPFISRRQVGRKQVPFLSDDLTKAGQLGIAQRIFLRCRHMRKPLVRVAPQVGLIYLNPARPMVPSKRAQFDINHSAKSGLELPGSRWRNSVVGINRERPEAAAYGRR